MLRECLNRVLILEEDHGECPITRLLKKWLTLRLEEHDHTWSRPSRRNPSAQPKTQK